MCGSDGNMLLRTLVISLVAVACLPDGVQAAFFLPAFQQSSSRLMRHGGYACPTSATALGYKDERMGGGGNDKGEGGDGGGGEDDPRSFQVFDDEECYDLCEVPEDMLEDVDAGIGRSKEEEEEEETLTMKMSEPSETAVMEMEGSIQELDIEDGVVSEGEELGEKYLSNLELSWSVQSSMSECEIPEETHIPDLSTCGEPCSDCEGAGKTECRFCGGTGFFTIGTNVYGGGRVCPVCKDGEEECRSCRGSGWVANWRMGMGFEPDEGGSKKNKTGAL